MNYYFQVIILINNIYLNPIFLQLDAMATGHSFNNKPVLKFHASFVGTPSNIFLDKQKEISCLPCNDRNWSKNLFYFSSFLYSNIDKFVLLLVLGLAYYVFQGRVTLFFADNFSTECRITMEFLHNFFRQ